MLSFFKNNWRVILSGMAMGLICLGLWANNSKSGQAWLDKCKEEYHNGYQSTHPEPHPSEEFNNSKWEVDPEATE